MSLNPLEPPVPPNTSRLLWSNADLIICHPHPTVENWLHYYHRSLAKPAPHLPAEVVSERVDLFRVLNQSPKVIVTYQGFLDKVVELTQKAGMQIQFADRRVPFPNPLIAQARGFIHSQFGMFVQMLQPCRSGLLKAPTRYGKCLGPGTPVLMFDGSVKPVEDVRPGDLLMGPDSKPRTVLNTVVGVDEMVEVVPNKGPRWTCTQDHVLSLRCNHTDGRLRAGSVINLTVQAYKLKSKTWRHTHKLWRTGVEFPTRHLVRDPYVVGAFLGDGSYRHNRFTDSDPAVLSAVRAWCHSNGFVISDEPGSNCRELTISDPERVGRTKGRVTVFRELLQQAGEKRIPRDYLLADRQSRLELLAGLLDTDGSDNGQMCFELTTKYPGLRDDILFLARSLGLAAYSSPKSVQLEGWTEPREYQRVSINGRVQCIPVRSTRFNIKRKDKFDATNVGFTVRELGRGQFYGFEIDGDGLFLLGDFTVTHNTALLANTCAVFPNVPTVITAPGASLLDQLVKDLRGWLPQRDIRGVFTGSKDRKPSDDISVVSMDSLHKVDAAAIRLLLIDEPHALPAASRLAKIMAFTQARIYGFGATLTGRFDHADKVIAGVVGPVLAEKSFREAVAENAICNIKVFILEMPVPEHFVSISDRLAAYRRLIYQSEEFNLTVRQIAAQVIPPDWQTLVFVDEIKQADLVQLMVDNGTVAVASRMSPAERRQTMQDMAGNVIKRCIATDIYAQGVTFPDLRVIVNASGGGGSVTGTQKPGRLAQKRLGKLCGYMIDFAFQSNSDRCGKGVAAVVRDCAAREKVYRDNGYEVVRVRRVDEIKLV